LFDFGFNFQLSTFDQLSAFSFQLSTFSFRFAWLHVLACSTSVSAFGLLGFGFGFSFRLTRLRSASAWFHFSTFSASTTRLTCFGFTCHICFSTGSTSQLVHNLLDFSACSQLARLLGLFTACSTSWLVYNLLPASACSLACIRSLRPVHKLSFTLGFASACLQRAQLLGLFTIFSTSRHSFYGHCAVGGEATP